MTDNKYENLTYALEKAKCAALVYAGSEDGGTCNFDSPTIDYRAMHMSKAKAAEAIKAAGLRCVDWHSYGGIMLVVCGIGRGQGNRNSRMAEAAEKSLKASGVAAGMYYQMD